MKTNYVTRAVLVLIVLLIAGGALWFNSKNDASLATSANVSSSTAATQNTSSTIVPTSKGAPSISIDQKSLTQQVVMAGSPTVTGTASNVAAVEVYSNGHDASWAPVTNGMWSAVFPNSKYSYPPGTYALEVQDKATGVMLAKAMLTVIAPAAVDMSSLTAKAGMVTITGTAPTLPSLYIEIDQDTTNKMGWYAIASSTVPVVNGHWSFTTPLKANTYDISLFANATDSPSELWYSDSPDHQLVVH